METKSRTVVEPAYDTDVRFYCETHPDRGNEFVDGTFSVEEVTPLTEEYTPNSKGNKLTWKDFEHYKCAQAPASESGHGMELYVNPWGYPNDSDHLAHASVSDPYLGYYQYIWGNYVVAPFGDAGRPIIGLPAYYLKREDGGFVPPPEDLDNLISRAMRSTLPLIKSELSIINSVIELRDFRRPVERALYLLRGRGFISSIRSLRRRLRNLTVGRVVQMAAGGYLQTQFNILPLISDIRAIYRALLRTQGRINDLVSRSGRRQNKHWMFKWDEHTYAQNEVSGSGGWIGDYLPTQTINSVRNVYAQPTVFHVQIQYNYNYTEYQTANAQLLGFLDALGIQLNPAILWNAIPWSFVVDWILGVSRYLNTLKVENMRPKINICRCLWSVLRKREIIVEKGISASLVPRIQTRNQLPVVYETAYRRQVFLPSSSSIESSGLSPTELSLGAALVVARRRRHHRRVL